MSSSTTTLLCTTIGVLAALPAVAASRKPAPAPASNAVMRLEVEPRQATLDGQGTAAVFVVTATLADGRALDVTPVLRPVVSGGAVRLTEDGRVEAKADGRATLTYRFRGREATASVEVTHGAQPQPLSYLRDVYPIFSKAGCSQGVCHGNANGKGGLKVSLRGQEPAADYDVWVHAGGGRRVNRQEPARSLLLQKATATVPHGGGLRFKPDSEMYRTLARWIAEGAVSDAETAQPPVDLSVFPAERVLYAGSLPDRKTLGTQQRLRVVARYADGRSADVTSVACYESSDADHVPVDGDGTVEAASGGEAGINVRFGGLMRTAHLTFVPERPAFAFQAFPVRSYIDELVLAKLKTVRIQPSALCDDSAFLRRAYLDALGIPPTVEEAKAFLADRSPDKRDRLVDALVLRPEFADFWVVKWADLLRAEERSLDPEGMKEFYGWLRESFRQDKGLDQLVRELLTATGNSYDHPATAYYRRTRSPELLAETTAQLFLGVRVSCAKCHNHPYDRWKQTDYHSLAAYFSRVDHENKYKPRRQRFDAEEINGDEIVVLNSTGEHKNPATGQPAPPLMLGDPASAPAPSDPDRRTALANWLTRPENPFFARAMANRIWYHLMGRGVVDAVDDFRDSNPPSNAPLMEALARDLSTHKFSLRHLAATILKSSTYQLSAAPTPLNEGDERYFSHAVPSRLTAEQLLEAVAGVTGAPDAPTGYPRGTHITQVVPTAQVNPFLRLFGQPARETVCECERSSETTLGQSFELVGGRLIDAKLRDPQNRLTRLLAAKTPPAAMVEELYLAAYARPPQPDEQRKAAAYLETAKDRRAALEDLTWALINTKEFLLRH